MGILQRLENHATTIWLAVIVLSALFGFVGTALALILGIFVLLVFIEGHLRQLVKLKRDKVADNLLLE